RAAGRSRWSGRRTWCAGGGADGGGAAASLPLASAARPPGGRSPLHLAHAADQGGSGGRRAYATDRGAAVIELAAPRLVSPRVRTLACSPLNSRASPLRLTRRAACY